MKFVAIIDEKTLTKQEIEGSFLLARDKKGKAYRLELKPLIKNILTTMTGENVYISQKQIDYLIELENSEIIQKLVGDMNSGVRLLGNDDLIPRESALYCCMDGWNKDYKEIAEDIRKIPKYGD